MDPGSAALKDELQADIERLELVHTRLKPIIKNEVFTSSSEDDEEEEEEEESEEEERDYAEFTQMEVDPAPVKRRLSASPDSSRRTPETVDDARQDSDVEDDASNEPSLENCLYLNRVYQDLIRESIEDLELQLKLNKENQSSVNDKIASNLAKKLSTSRTLDSFTCPYFKDADDITPPPNEDTKIKTANCELMSNIHHPRPWLECEKQQLVKAVKGSWLKKSLQGIMARKDMLLNDLDQEQVILTSEEIEKKMNVLKEKDEELVAVRNAIAKDPLGPIDADHDWLKICAVDFEGQRSAVECEFFWKNYLHPQINKGKWSKAEVDQLAETVKQLGRHRWEDVALALETHRTALQCFEKFQTKVNKDNLKGRWTLEEQERLTRLVETFRIGAYIPWSQVAVYFDGRSMDQIRHHWMYQLCPDFKKGKWEEAEDLLLLCAVWMFGPKDWWKIKDYVPGRVGRQCSERWATALNPELQLTPWTSEEDEKLVELVEKHGEKWSLVASKMHGRLDSAVSCRYRSLMRKKAAGTSFSKRSEFASAAIVKGQESHRARIYRRLIAAVRSYARSQGSETRDISVTALLQSIAGHAKGKSNTLSNPASFKPQGERKLTELLSHLPVDDLKKVLTRTQRRKANVAANATVEKELREYFTMASVKMKRGRPHRRVAIPEDDPGFAEWTEKFTDFLRGQPTGSSFAPTPTPIPFCPPMVKSLQAFRGVLHQKNRMQALPMARQPPTPSQLHQWQQNDDSYATLFNRFAALFFWPALFSLIEPEEDKTAPRIRRKAGYLKNPMKRKCWRKVRAAKEEKEKTTTTTTTMAETSVIAEEEQPVDAAAASAPPVLKKRPGRPKKTTLVASGQEMLSAAAASSSADAPQPHPRATRVSSRLRGAAAAAASNKDPY